ncbi:GTPase activating protein, partial [Irineochytrium annulatum]
MAVEEYRWGVLERFSRITRLATTFLDHPLAVPLLPYLPASLHPWARRDGGGPTDYEGLEYEPARVYLARWAHDVQVARSRAAESEVIGSSYGGGGSGFEDAMSNPPSPSFMLSSSATLMSSSLLEAARQYAGGQGQAAGRLRMLKEEERIVWDETVEALTGLGSFEVLSTDTTPPPPKVDRLKPLSRAEWALYFDHHIPFPPKPPSSSYASATTSPYVGGFNPEAGSMMESMIHISLDDAAPHGRAGRILVPIEDIQRRIFQGGLDPEIRSEVWRYLFHLFPWTSTHANRVSIKTRKSEEYTRLKSLWLSTAARLGDVDLSIELPDLPPPTSPSTDRDAEMYRDARTRVGKDVHRTDRGHPFYASRVNMDKLRDILITYACSYEGSDGLGFVQGMADLASPVLIVMEGDESDAFWCFADLMEKMKSNFRHDGLGMRTRLTTLSKLLQLTDPHLHAHLDLTGSSNLFCCFRWHLVLFKREFPLDDLLRLWECLQSGWPGDGFEHFVCLAILDEHRDAIVRHLYTFDEVLKYVNDLSGTVPLDPTLEAAELLYTRFR